MRYQGSPLIVRLLGTNVLDNGKTHAKPVAERFWRLRHAKTPLPFDIAHRGTAFV